jgi:hypothetical protein
MRKCLPVFLLVTVFTTNVFCQKPQVWMLGPMLHFNLNQKKVHTSWGLELAYWNYAHVPYSFDGGIEFEKKKIRLYSEAQTGIGVLGISIGPVIEFRTDGHKPKLGMQGSVWANYFGGFDIRFRAIGENTYFSPGIYFKLPLVAGSESHGHHHHWDWDD